MQASADIKIERLNEKNLPAFKQLIEVFDTVFKNHSNQIAADDYLIKLLAKNDFTAIAALLDDKVVAGLTAYELPAYYGNYSEVYIYDIAVKPEYQRKRIGFKLIDSIKQYCISNNIKTMFVEAETQDKNAVSFYRETNAAKQKVIHFEYVLNRNYNKAE